MKKANTRRVSYTGIQRDYLIERLSGSFGMVCWYCGVRLGTRTVQIDHIRPYSSFGNKCEADHISNLALSCKFCNTHKFDQPPEVFIRNLARIRSPEFRCHILPFFKDAVSNPEWDYLQSSFRNLKAE